jgi:pimeloyl-ACP methyl ester carboxylesterase
MVAPWWNLDRRSYRAVLHGGTYRLGIALEEPFVYGKPTVVFIHGGGGSPGQFAGLAGTLRGQVNLGALLYDDTARLAPAADMLREEVLALRGPVVLVAYSIGTLLPAYIGATDCEDRLHNVAAIYVNPLVGGSRYADADSALALLGDVPWLFWLHGVKRAIQRVFFPSIVQDLTPEGDFQQAIFGSRSPAPSLAARTAILFTERPGGEPDIREDRVRKLFGRSRQELIERMGTIVPVGSAHRTGHAAPLACPELVLPLVVTAIETGSASRLHR